MNPRGLKLSCVGLVVVLLALAESGCRRHHPAARERIPPRSKGPSLYGLPTGRASTDVARLRPPRAEGRDWRTAPFYLLQTELSPAILVHSSTRQLSLFAGATNTGLGAPTFVAWTTMNGPRTFRRGEPLDVTRMEECWVLAWWAGAEGWTYWDSPWVIFLQHKPQSMILDGDGLHLEFAHSADDVVLLPLYGYEKTPQKGSDFPAEHGLRTRKVKTWEWAKGLPRDPLTRVRYWAVASREFPIYCEDSFSVDRARDSVTIRSRFSWRSIDDDWKTRHVKLAPLSPPLAQAMSEGFPVKLSKRSADLDLFTAYGPYVAVEEVDEFDATLSVLQYLHETEAFDPPATNAHATVTLALDKLRLVAARKFKTGDRYEYDLDGPENFCRTIRGDGWYAKAFPYYDAPTRANALTSLQQHFREDVLVANRFQSRECPKGSGREYFFLDCPEAASSSVSSDAAWSGAEFLETLWAYAHFTGDWGLVRERWPLVKGLFSIPAETHWAGFGGDAFAGIGLEAAACAAFARLAYRAEDLDSYHYGCYLFARKLVQVFLKQRGADYFRQHQPWHSMEFLDEEVFLTALSGDGPGWQIDGPRYPAKAARRQFEQRWFGFDDADVARFFQDFLLDDVHRELNWLQPRWGAERRWHNGPQLGPSLVQLRSLLLHETPAELAAVATPDQFTGPPSGQIASCLSVLRASQPTRYERLIPPGDPSPFVAGLERDVASPEWPLVATVEADLPDRRGGRGGSSTSPHAISWPQLTWRAWTRPTGSGWTFGEIRPVREGSPAQVQTTVLNWNTLVVAYAPGI